IFFFFVFIFSIILYFIFKIFYKLKNKTKTINFKTIFKKFTLFLLPVYLLLFLVGGCSYKYMDPQYYEFKSLCKDIDNKVIIYNKAYWELYSDFTKKKPSIEKRVKDDGYEYFYYEKLNETFAYYDIEDMIKSKKRNGNIITIVYDKKYKKMPKPFASYIRYNYKNDGVFLRGDEGAGLYFTYEEVFTCSYFDNFK
ncbi:hypothetical protein C0L11_08855, partial [Campylobacter coli]|nr:hypothetical protein [Campylobacter coli]ECS1420730.1 hypothetical protein [Campylobacter coli]